MSAWAYGKIAYDAYSKSRLYTGLLPKGMYWAKWDDLPLVEKVAWEVAAQAVRESVKP